MPQPKNKPTEPAGARAFPKYTLEQEIAVPTALLRNGGNPLDGIGMATALGVSPGSSRLREHTRASSAYGLTGGSYKTLITLNETGRAIVSPTSPEERPTALVTAALTPPLFQRIFDYYKGKKFPERQFFINTVTREFGVDAAQAEACVDVFAANMAFVGLVRDTPGGDWLAGDAVPQGTATSLVADEVQAAEAAAAAEQVEPAPDAAEPPEEVTPKRQATPNRIFIGHGRNHKPLEQLTKTLDTMGIPYAVAEEEATVGRPISKKVRDTMELCGAAILIFSADREYRDKDGEPVWLPSENVSHELGAASIMYDDRIIIFKEESVQLASNFSGIGYITFEKNKLDGKVNDLLRELVAFKILKLSLGDNGD
jgi:predicted nucleotide-binding protein